jgi:hypothetical protein
MDVYRVLSVTRSVIRTLERRLNEARLVPEDSSQFDEGDIVRQTGIVYDFLLFACRHMGL